MRRAAGHLSRSDIIAIRQVRAKRWLRHERDPFTPLRLCPRLFLVLRASAPPREIGHPPRLVLHHRSVLVVPDLVAAVDRIVPVRHPAIGVAFVRAAIGVALVDVLPIGGQRLEAFGLHRGIDGGAGAGVPGVPFGERGIEPGGVEHGRLVGRRGEAGALVGLPLRARFVLQVRRAGVGPWLAGDGEQRRRRVPTMAEINQLATGRLARDTATSSSKRAARSPATVSSAALSSRARCASSRRESWRRRVPTRSPRNHTGSS